MAVWQYDLILVPKSTLVELSVVDKLNKKLFEEYDFWQNRYSIKDFKSFKKILPLGKSWSDEIVIYGDNDSHSLKLILENDYIVEVLFRLDFSKDYKTILENVLEYCLMKGLELIDQNLDLVKGDIYHLINEIKSSPQFSALRKLSKEE